MVALFLATSALAEIFHPFASQHDPRWAESPLASAATVEFGVWRPTAVTALHPASDLTVRERDRLWVTYVKWLEGAGYLPARPNHSVPWRRARWQRFEREDGPIELEIRKRHRHGAWEVLILPRGGGSGGAPW